MTTTYSGSYRRVWRPLPWPVRYLAWILTALQVGLPVLPQVMAAEASATPQTPVAAAPAGRLETPPPAPQVTVNRTVPAVTPFSPERHFSETPANSEIIQSHVFGQPLVPMGATTADENRQLARALMSFCNRTNSDDVEALTRFLDTRPHSAWKASLLFNLGIQYRHTGWFTKALDVWDQAWELTKNQTDSQVKELADVVVAELLQLNARLGRYDRLESLFTEIKGRNINPALLSEIQGAREGLWLMVNYPQNAFRCGPMALSQIGPAPNSPHDFYAKIIASRSTPRGMSLKSICDLANELGMNFQMAWRSPGSPVILPVVIHWKAGHYAPLVKASGGKYLIKDPTFGEGIWISQAALDNEASGYCLVAAGDLPSGWRTVSDQEAQTIWGKGNPGLRDPGQTGPDDPKCPPCNGQDTAPMARYAVHAMLVSLNIVDTPVGYAPPRGPGAHFQVTYNQKEAYPPNATPPANFGYPNLGAQWTFNWMAYIVDDPIYTWNDAYYFIQGGGYEDYTDFNPANQTYAIQPHSQAILVRTSPSSYERDLPDGSKQIFSLSDHSTSYPRKIFLTQIIDPAGNAQTFIYNSVAGSFQCQLVAVQDAIGQVTTLSYGLANDVFKITQVTDPFGRSATFQYNGSGQLTNITDILGITSAFSYDTNGSVVSLTTPYGTTTFAYADNGSNSWIETTDPLGQKERVEYIQGISNVPYSESTGVPSGPGVSTFDQWMNYRNTFYWDKRAMQLYPGDYTKATIYHWLHSSDVNVCSGVLESTKKPLENRVWYDYPGQSQGPQFVGTMSLPSTIARVLDDGTSQIYQYQYNSIGKPTLVVDPANRTAGFIYSTNNIDLLQVYQMVGATSSNVLGQFTYNSQHQPLTTVNAAGQTNFFGYNPSGQLIAMTNALNEITLLNYDTNGYLTSIVVGTTTQLLSTNSFTYDGYGRVRTVADPLGYTITTSYDAADRPTNMFYPDGTYQQTVYNCLDPVLTRDRNGHWTAMAYDPLRRLTDTYDNLGRHTHFDWCNCGSLTGITDPLGNVTTWVRDLQGRVTAKIYPDTTQINYAYENTTSRLKSVTDAKNQSTIYSYLTDNNLAQVAYSNAVVATPSVSFTYDTNYNRMVTMTDGTGVTTYNYYPIAGGQLGAGMLFSIFNSFVGGTITYNYDALGRVTNRAIDGVSQQIAFDALHRVTMVTNALGSFTNTYLGATALITTNFYPNGQQTVFSYLSVTNDERLADIWNQNNDGSTLSKFDYSYDPVGNFTTWTRQVGANTPTAYSYGYDAGNQVISAVLNSTGPGATILKQFAYSYDLAGNRTSEQIDTGMSQSSYNVANQLTSRSSSGGSMMFAGVLDKQGTVTVAGNPAAVNHFTTNFVGYANVTSGTNVVQIIATDYNGNSRTNNYQLVVTNNGVAETITYDLNGNETSVVTITSTSVYQWDAANRLVSIIGPTNQSLFTYDGLGRQVQDIELQNGMAVSTNTFLWDGQTLAEQRDNTRTNVVKRFFGEGEQISGTSYFFTRDHLGSIREMTDAAGTIRARYDYDPYGRRMKIQGDLDADFGYAGMYYHTASGLLLTFYRAYDSDLGRWMSRDPLEEAAGLNLYTYVANNPVRFIDPLGNDIGIYGGGTGDQNNPYLFIPQPSTTSPSLGLNLGLGGGGYYFVGAEGTISTCRCCENGKKYRVSVLTVCSGIGFDMKFKGKLPKIAKPSPPIPGSVSSGESSCPPPVKYYLKSAIDLGPLEIATSGTSLNISAGLGIRILLFCSDTVISKQPVQ